MTTVSFLVYRIVTSFLELPAFTRVVPVCLTVVSALLANTYVSPHNFDNM